MNSCIKFLPDKEYVYFYIFIPLGLFLLNSCFLIFRPFAKDILPGVLIDIVLLLVIIALVRRYIIILDWCKLPALELNENEIVLYMQNVRVRWINVSDIRLKRERGGYYIVVRLKDKKGVLAQKNIFFRGVFYLNILISGSPVVIPLTLIEGMKQDIFEKMCEYFKE